MTVREVQKVVEAWAPPEIAWERDNVGLQSGQPSATVRGILVTLDVTEPVIDEAVRRRANLIISHHPLLFNRIGSVTTENETGRCLRVLVRRNINLYAAHTNLDCARGGTSFALAETLGLEGCEFLQPLDGTLRKIVTFVPPADAERVARAMSAAGAGIIGKYGECSFRVEGTGTFIGNEESRPSIGRRGVLEHVRETRLEMIAPRWMVPRVLRALTREHPYEEVACDVYPTENTSREFGMGVIGHLRRPTGLEAFLGGVKRSLGVPTLRCSGRLKGLVRSVAVCGGSGSDLVEAAIRQGAEVFVTSDVRYHVFHRARPDIVLVDAGHFETERPVIQALVNHLRRACRDRSGTVPVHAARSSTNPVVYV